MKRIILFSLSVFAITFFFACSADPAPNNAAEKIAPTNNVKTQPAQKREVQQQELQTKQTSKPALNINSQQRELQTKQTSKPAAQSTQVNDNPNIQIGNGEPAVKRKIIPRKVELQAGETQRKVRVQTGTNKPLKIDTAMIRKKLKNLRTSRGDIKKN